MTEDVVQVSLDGLLALQSAAKSFARAELSRIAGAAIADLLSQPIVGYYEGVAARHIWDEYCWALQDGPLGECLLPIHWD